MRLVKEAFAGLSASAIIRCSLRADCTPPDITRLSLARLDVAEAVRDPYPVLKLLPL